jgi:hypothetical protein
MSKEELLKALETKSIEELEALFKIALQFKKDELLKIPKALSQYKSLILKYI